MHASTDWSDIMRRVHSIISLSIIFVLVCLSVSWAELLKRDDFQDRKSWWSWESIGGGVSPSVHDGIVILVVNYGTSSGPSDSAIWDGANIYDNCTVNIRAKAISPMRPGTIGWGFWNYVPPWYSFDIADSNIAWFMKQYNPYDASMTWWGTWTRNAVSGNSNFLALPNIDVNQWHLYRIERYDGVVRFYVDGSLVAFYSENLPQGPLAFHLWVDNYNYPFDPTDPIVYRAFSQPSILIADFVEIYNEQLGSSETPSGSLLLKKMPNESGIGQVRYLWEDYSFESPGGKLVAVVTGRAENYGTYSDDDDMRVVIDDTDLGWDTSVSFDGQQLNGSNKSLVYIDQFEGGAHSIKIFGDVTPLLYDVTVVGSENGDVMLSYELNERAPGGSNYLWKEYEFTTKEEEEVVFIVSASANQNSGSHDDLRIVIDDEDHGWDSDFAVSGDQLFGEAKVLTIRRDLLQGPHVLRIYASGTPTLHNIIIYGSEEIAPTNQPPILGFIGNRSLNEGETLDFSISANDPDGDGLTCSSANLPAGAIFDPVSCTFTWTPTNDQAGTYSNILFTVTDDGVPPLSDSETITITVGDVNRPPVLDAIGSRSVNEGETLTFTVTGSDPDGHGLNWEHSGFFNSETFPGRPDRGREEFDRGGVRKRGTS